MSTCTGVNCFSTWEPVVCNQLIAVKCHILKHMFYGYSQCCFFVIWCTVIYIDSDALDGCCEFRPLGGGGGGAVQCMLFLMSAQSNSSVVLGDFNHMLAG